jgi:phenylacetate-CoA ligase
MFPAYSKICEKIILPLADVATRQRTMESYRFYCESQWWDRDRLCEYQDARVQELVRTSYLEVPFYRELFDKHRVDINSIVRVKDLQRLPVVTKTELRNAYPSACTRETGLPWSECCTSGSSGKPFAVRIDDYSMSQARALMMLRANFSMWNIGEPFLQTGMTLNRGVIKKCKDVIMRVHYVSAFNLSDRMLDEYLERLSSKNLRFVMGYASSLYCLAVRALEVGFNRNMGGVVSWGDNLYDHYRAKIEQAFGCRVTDTYGCGEGIQVAAQCGANDGAYHVFMPHVAVEVVGDGGEAVPPGEPGTILLTRLDAGAMPLIRYKVGDIGRMSPNAACSCGRGLEMLTKIEGRDTDVVMTPGGNRLIVHFFTGIFEYYPSVDTFKVIQEKLGAITVEIVPRPGFTKADWEKIKSEILDKGDRDLDIQLNLVDDIPLEKSHKRRFVVSRL